VSAVVRIALADWQARTRSFAFVLITALALEAAYLLIPDARAGYVTVSVGNARGIYNAPWMGAITALLTVVLLANIGFYVVRGALVRDVAAGCSAIVAASPIRRFTFVAGKWASNVAVLSFIGAIVLVGCAVMQQVRGESRAFDTGDYVLPFVAIVVPACAMIAAFAVLFDAIRPLRGVIGGALWFFLVTALVATPLAAWTAGKPSAMIDPLGVVPLVDGMARGVVAAFPGTSIRDVAIGATDAASRTFTWHGMTWTASIGWERLAWFAVALAIVGLASLAFDRFAHARTATARRWRFPVARIIPDIVGLRLLRAELAILADDSGFWWTAAAIACGIAGAFAPASGLVSAILPLALLLPLARYGTLGTRDRATGVDALVLSAPGAAWRTIAARVLAAGLVGCVPLAGALARYPALAIVPFAAAALAIVVGRLSGTPRSFEAIYLAVWYLGALNHAPIADLPADAHAAPATLVLAGALTTLIAALVARAQLIVWRPSGG
jgi:hypothetical protein